MIINLGKINFRGHECYITDYRIRESIKRPSLYYYEIRHSDEDFSEPVTVEPKVIVNHWGTLVSKDNLDYLMDKRTHYHEIELTKEEIEDFFEALGDRGIKHEDIYRSGK